jgi:hypothetical protein
MIFAARMLQPIESRALSCRSDDFHPNDKGSEDKRRMNDGLRFGSVGDR